MSIIRCISYPTKLETLTSKQLDSLVELSKQTIYSNSKSWPDLFEKLLDRPLQIEIGRRIYKSDTPSSPSSPPSSCLDSLVTRLINMGTGSNPTWEQIAQGIQLGKEDRQKTGEAIQNLLKGPVPIETQKKEALRRINEWVRDNHLQENVVLIRNLIYLVELGSNDPTVLEELNLEQTEPDGILFPSLPDIFDLPFLQCIRQLNISNHKMTDLPSSLKSLPNLKKIIANRNSFRSFPLILTQMPALEVVDLSCNFIQNIPESISQTHLERIDLSDNRVKHIPDCGIKTQIHLSTNPSEGLPEENWKDILVFPDFLAKSPAWQSIISNFNPCECPTDLCDTYSERLKTAMLRAYRGQICDGKVQLTIGGTPFTLTSVITTTKKVPGKGPHHHFLLLSNGQEKWFIDPTWKQFALPRENTPFRDRIFSSEFPAVLAMKKENWAALTRSLSNMTENPAIAACYRYWCGQQQEV